MNEVGTQIHSTAIVDHGAEIGANTKVWHWTHVCKNAKIGKGCSLGQNVYVAANVSIGNNVKIQNNVSIYEGVIIESNVFCGPSMVFTNVYNPRAEFARKNQYKQTIIRKGVTMGANCTIVCGIEAGEYAFIGAGALVKESVPAFALIVGVPAVQIGWISRFGETLPIKYGDEGEYCCQHTGETYRVTKESCEILS